MLEVNVLQTTDTSKIHICTKHSKSRSHDSWPQFKSHRRIFLKDIFPAMFVATKTCYFSWQVGPTPSVIVATERGVLKPNRDVSLAVQLWHMNLSYKAADVENKHTDTQLSWLPKQEHAQRKGSDYDRHGGSVTS